MIISFANKKDIKSILKIQGELLLDNKDNNKNSLKNGFLVYPADAEQIRKVLETKKNMVLCAKENGDLVGYILAYDLKNWMVLKPDWKKNIKTSQNIKSTLKNSNYIYLRHIARKIGHENVGAELLEYFLNVAKESKVNYVICEILENHPKNQISINFFTTKFMFKRIGEITYKDNLTWGIYLYKL